MATTRKKKRVLFQIWQNTGDVTIRRLATLVKVSPPTILVAISQLERLKWLRVFRKGTTGNRYNITVAGIHALGRYVHWNWSYSRFAHEITDDLIAMEQHPKIGRDWQKWKLAQEEQLRQKDEADMNGQIDSTVKAALRNVAIGCLSDAEQFRIVRRRVPDLTQKEFLESKQRLGCP